MKTQTCVFSCFMYVKQNPTNLFTEFNVDFFISVTMFHFSYYFYHILTVLLC